MAFDKIFENKNSFAPNCCVLYIILRKQAEKLGSAVFVFIVIIFFLSFFFFFLGGGGGGWGAYVCSRR